jgi:nitrogen fixation NifU-like protein
MSRLPGLNREDVIVEDEFWGRMTDPSAGAWHTGACGDTMEFYLVIEDDIIRTVRYHTDGCEFTRQCGRTVARYVQGQSLPDALSINVRTVLEALPELPQAHRHCAVLAVMTFYQAIGQFWLERARS